MSRLIRNLALLALVLGLAGCQTVKGVGTRIDRALDKVMGSKGQRLDPWESWNRKVFAFNESLDANVLKPVATAYSEIVPSPIRTGIDNFFGSGDSYRTDNDSYLRLDADVGWNEVDSWGESELDHKFRLDLPTAKERLRLVFESDPAREWPEAYPNPSYPPRDEL